MQRPSPWLRRRWHFVALYWLAQAVAAYFLAIMLVWVSLSDVLAGGGLLFWLAPFAVTAVILLLQAVFLLPVRRPAPSARGWPVLVSLAIGGALVALLVMALTLAVGHVIHEYTPLDIDDDVAVVVLPAVLVGTWLVSTPLLVVFCRRGRRERVVQRLAAGLFVGTIIEAAAIIPLDALVRRREDCICGTGTFVGLAICGSVGVFVFGPAIVLPLVIRHRKRWYGRRCDACGYDMQGLGAADRCPECGAGWRSAAGPAQG